MFELIRIFLMRLYSILSDHSLYDYHKKVHGLLIEYRQLEKSGNTVQLKSKKNVGTLFRKIKKLVVSLRIQKHSHLPRGGGLFA